MAVIEDLAAYMQAFGVDVTLGAGSVRAIFDAGYSGAQVGSYGMATTSPQLMLPTADVPASPVGTAVTVEATAYTVAEHRPDGTGVSLLLLEAA